MQSITESDFMGTKYERVAQVARVMTEGEAVVLVVLNGKEGSGYAVHADSGFFQLSEPGMIQVLDEGGLAFHPSPEGKHKSLSFIPTEKDKIIQAYIDLASAKPVPRPSFRKKQP